MQPLIFHFCNSQIKTTKLDASTKLHLIEQKLQTLSKLVLSMITLHKYLQVSEKFAVFQNNSTRKVLVLSRFSATCLTQILGR